MKRIIVIVCLALVGVMSLTAGVREDFKANPKLSANNYQAYPVDGFPAITPAPAGYAPFFINHYGRHGSRWLINDKKYSYPLQMLEKGERYGKLTRRGQEVLDTLRLVYEASHGRLGELSDLGHEQHQGIARRMFQNFPQVFVDGAPVIARSTVVIRCILSMQNEVDMLASLNPRLKISTDASQATMYYMNYSDSVVKPLRQKMTPVRDELMKKWLKPKGMLKKLFNDQKFARDSVSDPYRMMLYLGRDAVDAVPCGLYGGQPATQLHRGCRPRHHGRQPVAGRIAAVWPRERGAAAVLPDGLERSRLPHDRPGDAGPVLADVQDLPDGRQYPVRVLPQGW